MFTTVTIKLQAQTDHERIHTLKSQIEQTQKHFEECKNEGFFGPPELVDLRYLVDTEKLRPGLEANSDKPDTANASKVTPVLEE